MTESLIKALYFTYAAKADEWLQTKKYVHGLINLMVKQKRIKAAFLADYLHVSRVYLYEKLKTEFSEKDTLLIIELFGCLEELQSEWLTENYIKKKLKKL